MRKVFAKLSTQIWRQDSVFAQTAFESPILAIAAALSPADTKLRILKDGFFGFSKAGNTGCGFHCDDKFFWPTADDTTGVNVWLTLSPISNGSGGIRVVNQSLAAPFHDECLSVIRTSGNGNSSNYNATCHMEQLSPSCFRRMMEASVVHDMEPGDALFWDRWTFHRSEPFAAETNNDATANANAKLRYTIRYVPDTATAQGVVHPSVPQGAPLRGPFYPQVWPVALQEEVEAIRTPGRMEADFEPGLKTIVGIMWRRLLGMMVQGK